ncbi:hypothetical protein PJ311_16755 [Bacillus sp. CLL-7-23]|uniref:DUF4365 domain-containing protein n=1 Tax=Bacillus changyiensis TaxID=3004103 RepID=A0ABT4X7E8_9BACI|nr:hypothetical protein [Bacillus changyiensis]MDA7028220.1 hypothetical protein [Bacillus changyiensis]
MRDINFFKNLYFGMGGEYLVMSDFIMRGFEAVKITPDFGYDVLVTNKHKYLSQQFETEKELYLQVKTRLIYPEANNTALEVFIEKNNFSYLLSDEKAHLVIVTVKGVMVHDSWSEDPSQRFDWNAMSRTQRNLDRSHYQYFKPHYFIWLSHSDLIYLHKSNFTSECTIENIQYIKIRYDSNFIIDNNGESHLLGDSRTHLFSITDMDFWNYNHQNLFI